MFYEAFNVEILRANELGLMQKWSENARIYQNKKIFVSCRKNKVHNRKPFTLLDLYLIFLIWGIGILISTGVFVGELLLP